MLTDDPLPTLAFALEDTRQRHIALAWGRAPVHPQVVMFPQCWRHDALPQGNKPASCAELHTVVVMDADGGAHVYFGPQLAYRVTAPNRRFFLDVAAQCMVSRQECGRYEGVDDEEVQSLDYGLEMKICRWQAQIKSASPSQCQLAARLLHGYADRFERCAPPSDRSSANSEAFFLPAS